MTTVWVLGLTFFWFTSVWNPVHSCGVSTHLDVAHRALAFFEYSASYTNYKQILEEHVDAFQGSTSFADIFYNEICLPDGANFGYVSEDTHWTPFINVSVNYIRDTYPQPWDEATEKLVTFLFGIVSHQVSDVLWHALDVDQAFLQTMGNINFHGSFDAAHGVGDFGGDVINRYDLDMSYIKKLFYWYIPVDDLVNIYRLYYGDDRVTADALVSCSNWFYLARLGEQLGVIEMLFPANANVSPFLIDRLQDFFLGGMDDMALWILDRWHVVADLLEYGTDYCELTRNPVFITCDEERIHQKVIPSDHLKQKKQSVDGSRKSPEYSRFVDAMSSTSVKIKESDVILKKKHRGITLEMGADLKKLLGESLERYSFEDTTSDKKKSTSKMMVQSATTYTTGEEYSRLGETLLFGDVNTDGYDDLIIGAPSYSVPNGYQNGRVYIIYGNEDGFSNQSLSVEESADLILEAPDGNGRFGTAVVVIDLNQDGKNDLLVTAPLDNALYLTYQGSMYFYYNRNGETIEEYPGSIQTCLEHYCNAGSTFSTAYLNSDDFLDVIIGSPYSSSQGDQKGSVEIRFSNNLRKDPLKEQDKSINWRSNEKQNYGWFGFSIAASSSYAAVSAPSYRICTQDDCEFDEDDVQAVGRVYLYSLSEQDHEATITGQAEFEQFGYDLLAIERDNEEFLLVSAPTAAGETIAEQPGVVRLYSLTNWNSSIVEIEGDRKYSRFGASMAKVNNNPDEAVFVVGAPRWRDDDNSHFGGGGPGRAYVYRMTSDAQVEVLNTLVSDEPKSQFGKALASSKFSSKTVVAVGAPYSNKGSRLGGSVELFFL